MVVSLRQVRVDIEQDRVRVLADTAYGPARLVWVIAGKPVATREGFSLQIDETRVGRVPVPVRYGGWIVEKVRGALRGTREGKSDLERRPGIRADNGRIRA